MPTFTLPDLGEGLTEAEVVSWRVAVGDEVGIDQVVVEVETAKSVVEVPVPFAGTVTATHGEPGQTLAVGAPLISVGEAAGITSGTAAIGFIEPGVVQADSTPTEPAEASGNVLIGYGTPNGAGARRRRRPVPIPSPGADSSVVTGRMSVGAGLGAPRPGPPRVISPLVRKLAVEAGIDLAGLTGTGADGVIRRADIEKAIAGTAGGATQADETAAGPGATRIPLTGSRRFIADKMSRSRREIPEATVWVDVDATALFAARAELNRAELNRAGLNRAGLNQPVQPISILALVARFTLLALRQYPVLAGTVDEAAGQILVPSGVNLGVAAQTDRGLIVPVIREAHRLSTAQLSTAIGQTIAAARAGGLPPERLTGGTFTLNNYGVFGVDGSAPIINHPEVAMLGVGRLIDRPWVVDGQVVPRRVGQLSLVFDHRVCDGAVAGGFLRLVADYVESPITALAQL